MSTLVTSSIFFVLLSFHATSVLPDRTEQYPFNGQFPASTYNFLAQQAPQDGLQGALQQSLLSQPQAGLQSLQQPSSQFSPQLLQQAQFPQQASLLQPLASEGFGGASAMMADQAQQASSLSQMPQVSQMPQIMASMVSVPMQAVVELMQSVESLQKNNKGLERQLSETRAHAVNAAARSNNIDESARKLASLAQASVNQAQKSVDNEKTMVENLKKHLTEVEQEKDELDKEKQDLRTQLSQSRAALKSVEDSEALEADAKRELSTQLLQHQLDVPPAPRDRLAQLSDSTRFSGLYEGLPDHFGATASQARALQALPKTLIERLRSQPRSDFLQRGY